ncbi:MAG TPA: hypothetical protein VKB70_04485, partial [Gaiellaceae bacterium]|nr:hypothetical protein [Gaiellaceae bacterium]
MTKCLGALVVALALTGCAAAHSASQMSSVAARHRPLPATQEVDTHGIEVAVPARWKLGRGMCGTPRANTVMWNSVSVLSP